MTDLSHAPRRIAWDFIVERFYPLALGIAATACWLIWGSKLFAFASCQHWHIDQFYSAIFAFLAITTGFLATFYCTVVAMTDGFARIIRERRVFKQFLGYVKNAIKVGFMVSIASIPMMVVQPEPMVSLSWWGLAVAAWIGAAVWAIAAFFRVASFFFFLFEADVQPRRPAR